MLRVGGVHSVQMGAVIEKRINNLIKSELEKEGIDQKTTRGFVVSTEKIVGRYAQLDYGISVSQISDLSMDFILTMRISLRFDSPALSTLVGKSSL